MIVLPKYREAWPSGDIWRDVYEALWGGVDGGGREQVVWNHAAAEVEEETEEEGEIFNLNDPETVRRAGGG